MRARKPTGSGVLRRAASASRKIVSVFLAILFAAALSVALIGRIFFMVALDQERHLALIEETRLVSRSRGLLANLLVTYALQSEQSDTLLDGYSMRVWESVADAVIDHEWLRSNVDYVAREFFAWFSESETPMPEITIDLRPVNSVLRSPQGALAILPLLGSAQPCAASVSEVSIMSGSLIDCVPDGLDLAVVGMRISERIADYMPAEIALQDLTASEMIRPSTIEAIERVRVQVRAAERGVSLTFRVAILALCLYALLNSASVMRLLQSLRLPLYMASGLTLILLGTAYGLLEFGFPYFASNAFRAFSSDIQVLIVDLARRLGEEILVEWAKLGSVVLGLAVAFHIAVAIISRSTSKAEEIAGDLSIRRSRIRKEFR